MCDRYRANLAIATAHWGRVLSAAMLMAPGAAQSAQDKLVGLEEIVVTATRRPVPLLDVPVAVSVLTAEDIVARGFSEYGDYLNSLPGVYFFDAGPGRSVIRIRGVSAGEGGTSSLVGTYFGETPTSADGTYQNLRLVDIEHVEVLRGPQGTLFGANALAGVLRILPAQPDLESYQLNLTARGLSTAHSDDPGYQIEGVVNLPLAKDQFALRLVGYKHDMAGYIENLFPAGQPALDWSAAVGAPPGTLVIPAIAPFNRTDINREDTVGARAAAAWQATERLRFEFDYVTQESTLESEPHVTPSVGEYAHTRSMDAFSQAESTEEIDITSLTVRYDWDAVSFVSASALQNFGTRQFADFSELVAGAFGVPIPGELRTVAESEVLTQELRLQSRGDGAFQWLFGVFYLDRDRGTDQEFLDLSCPACISVVLAQEDVLLRGHVDSGAEQRAVFGEVSYDFSPRWTASVGARWLEEDIQLRISDLEGLLGGQPDTNTEGSADEFNPAAHLRFRPSDDLALYAQAARGFRSGQPNQQFPPQCQAQAEAIGLKLISDPDTLWNYELGLKSFLADGRLSLNAAVYHGDWEGIQLAAGLTCGFVGVLNAGDATTQGVELELTAQASNAWRFNLAASYNETKFTDVEAATGYIDGETVPDSPEMNASAGVQYDFNLGSEWSGFARADYQYVGDIERIFLGAQPRNFTQDAYGTGNVRLGFSRNNLALEFFGRNVTDERAVVFIANPALGADQVIIRPRELGIELRYRY
ncbi:MAG: TonB-dependent receptor [Steroidobacteraceae bacterium]